MNELEIAAHIGSVRKFTALERQFMDNAFENVLAPSEVHLESHTRAEFNIRGCRAAFIKFFISIFGDVQDFLLFPAEDNANGFEELFDVKSFLASKTYSNKKFLKDFMGTQCFVRYVEERTFVSSRNDELKFFDRCYEMEYQLNRSRTKTHTRSLSAMSPSILVQHLVSAEVHRQVYAVPPPLSENTSKSSALTVQSLNRQVLFHTRRFQSLILRRCILPEMSHLKTWSESQKRTR